MFHPNPIEFSLFITTFNKFINEIFYQYLPYYFVSAYFIDGFTNEIWSLKKITKPNFCVFFKTKTKPKLVLVQFGYFRTKTETQPIGFGSVRLFYIKNQKLYCFLGFFL